MTPVATGIDSVLLRPGTVVETTFGVGVVIGPDNNNNTPGTSATTHCPVQVQLWRLPGRSLGTGTTAYLQPSAVSVVAWLLYCIAVY